MIPQHSEESGEAEMGQSKPSKLDRKIVVAINRRHLSEKQKLRNVAKRAGK